MDSQPSPRSAHTSELAYSTLDPEEWDPWYGVLERAFGGLAEASEERALWHDLTESDRSIAVHDSKPTKQLVAASSAFTFQVAVPGGALVPAAGVTMVGVLPTHRRRGVLTAMMRRLLDDARERSEPLAVLTASEPGIYGRFGYGVASSGLRVRLPSHRVRLAPDAPQDPSVRLRLTEPQDSAAVCEALYTRLGPQRPGWIARPAGWERQPLLDPESYRQGNSPLATVLAEDEGTGELRGYAHYCVKPSWEWSGPQGTVTVREIQAADPAAYAALWRFLLEVDLTDTVQANDLPVDDPLLHLVTDVRRCDMGVRDRLHARLVDVRAALESRIYAHPVDVVLEVEDAFCPWNEGRWRLSADAKGQAVCERTASPADLALSARELGAAYLGGTGLAALAAAGRVTELREGALAAATTAFATVRAPYLPRGF